MRDTGATGLLRSERSQYKCKFALLKWHGVRPTHTGITVQVPYLLLYSSIDFSSTVVNPELTIWPTHASRRQKTRHHSLERPELVITHRIQPTMAQKYGAINPTLAVCGGSSDIGDGQKKKDWFPRARIPCMQYTTGIVASVHAISFVVIAILDTVNEYPTFPVYASSGRWSNETNSTIPMYLPDAWWHLSPAKAVLVFLAISSVAQTIAFALYSTIPAAEQLPSTWAKLITQGRNPLRWVEYFFSASTMMLLLAFFMGVVDGYQCSAVCGLVGVTQLFGFLAEEWYWQIWSTSSRDSSSGYCWKLLPHLCGWIPQLMVSALVWTKYVHLTSVKGNEPPDFVLYIVIVQQILFTCFGLVQPCFYWRRPTADRMLLMDFTYVVLSGTAKTVLAWMVFGYVLM